jgi:transcriptional regulator with GAF, ATPase, and Fis domain
VRKPSESSIPTSTIRTSAVTVVHETVAFQLMVIEGRDDGMAFTVDGTAPGRTLAGTSTACEIRFTDASVSRRHAAFDVEGSDLRVTDLASKNGTKVNGVRVFDGLLLGGEIVKLGGTTCRVERLPGTHAGRLTLRQSFGKVIGGSERMRRIYPLCERLSRTDVSVVIEGETGTGKEVLAESIHELGDRAEGPFVVFDCTTVPTNLVESALFGHERGAFTGAVSAHAGVFEQAHGGTLLIDEIGDLDIALQPKLLRVLQSKVVQRVGGSHTRKVDVRLIAATRRSLDHEVQAGRFRDDLFFRLNVARVELPPLREREGDVPVLAAHFWKSLGGISEGPPPELMVRLEDYNWPGNVRELQNVIARTIALGDLANLKLGNEDFVPSSTRTTTEDYLDRIARSGLQLIPARERVVEEFEKRYLRYILDQHGGNVTRAAEASGIARRYFHRLKARHEE